MEVDSTAMAASPLPQPPTLPSSSSSQETQQPSSHERSNFRRELYARSTDRSTVEDMADMVVHRYILAQKSKKKIKFWNSEFLWQKSDFYEAGGVLLETLRRGPYAVVDRAERAKTPSSLVQIMKCYSVTFSPNLDPSTHEMLLRHFSPRFGP